MSRLETIRRDFSGRSLKNETSAVSDSRQYFLSRSKKVENAGSPAANAKSEPAVSPAACK